MSARWVFGCILLLMLSACGTGYHTDGEVVQTAVAVGCWDDPTRPTPPAVTVTAWPTAQSGMTATPAPTTTPLPRCTPVADATLVPWPTPLPTRVPFPTLPPADGRTLTQVQAVMTVPNLLLDFDLATHPTAGWPVIAAIDVPLTQADPPRVFVRAWNPATGLWGTLQTVDLPGTHAGRNHRSVAVTVTHTGEILVFWVSERLTLFVAQSTDVGHSWSNPTAIGTGFTAVRAVSVGFDGQVEALALRLWHNGTTFDGVDAVHLVRDAAGVWRSPTRLPEAGPVWSGSRGAMLHLGSYAHPSLVLAITNNHDELPETLTVLRRVGPSGPWRPTRLTISDGGGSDALQTVRLIAFPRPGSTEGLALLTTVLGGSSVSVATSPDAGESWRSFQLAARGTGSIDGAGLTFDPATNRLIAIWECCGGSVFGSTPATQYASWADVDVGVWSPAPGTLPPPLVTGARAAALTRTVSHPQTAMTFLVWSEDGRTIRLRAIDTHTIVPTS